MGEFVTDRECKAFQDVLLEKMERTRNAVENLAVVVEKLTDQITIKTIANGVQNVAMERLSGRIATLEKEDTKKHNWALYLFMGALTLVNIVATVLSYLK